jgi:hypothetical protein
VKKLTGEMLIFGQAAASCKFTFLPSAATALEKAKPRAFAALERYSCGEMKPCP